MCPCISLWTASSPSRPPPPCHDVSMSTPTQTSAYSFGFRSFFTTGFFSSLTFALGLLADPFAFLANGFSSSLSLSGSALTFLTLLVDARGLAAGFFLASGFSSSESSPNDDSSLSSLRFGFALVLPLDLRGAALFAASGFSSSESSESEGVFLTRRG